MSMQIVTLGSTSCNNLCQCKACPFDFEQSHFLEKWSQMKLFDDSIRLVVYRAVTILKFA